jgi:hypothetical protein
VPRVYLVAVCRDSSLDSSTNNWSLFQLIEAIQGPQFPVDMPAEIHISLEFDEAERGRPHEVRVALETVGGNIVWRSQAANFTSATARLRTVGQGLRVPSAGMHHLFAEIRPADAPNAPWSRSPVGWPLEVIQAPNEAPQLPQPPQPSG